jgi:GNAT superfamily N-acetyltransferase
MTESGRMTGPVPPPDILADSIVVLRDGSEVAIVPMATTDSARLMRFHHTLSEETIYRRFFFFHPELSEKETNHFTHVDHHDREALVAVADDEIVAVARFDRLDEPSEAEVAFVVADSWQGRGIGSLLFARLAQLARESGVTRFVADTLPHNKPMLGVFRHAQLPIVERASAGVVHVTLELGPPG